MSSNKNPEIRKKYEAEYHQAHLEEIHARHHAYDKAHKEIRAAQNVIWKRNNPEKVVATAMQNVQLQKINKDHRLQRQKMNKYHNRKTKIDGNVFDSMAEARRYSDLRLLEKAGELSDLELQPKYKIVVNGKNICTYVADFRYTLKVRGGNAEIVEDVKGVRTAVYRLKKKLTEAIYGIEISEIK